MNEQELEQHLEEIQQAKEELIQELIPLIGEDFGTGLGFSKEPGIRTIRVNTYTEVPEHILEKYSSYKGFTVVFDIIRFPRIWND